MNVEDRLAIQNLIARVAWHTDQWETPEQLGENYAENGEWILGDKTYDGRDGIARRAKEMHDLGICGPGIPTRHCVTSLEIVEDGGIEGNPLARSLVIQTETDKQGQVTVAYGEYHDTVVKVDGEWKVRQRLTKATAGYEEPETPSQ